MKKWGQSLIYDPDDRSLKSKLLRSTGNFLIFSFIAGVLYYSFSSSGPRVDSRFKSREVAREFERISPPAGVSAVGKISMSSKSSHTSVSQRYFFNIPTNIILMDYDRQLKNAGWSYLRHYYGGFSGGESYCKEGIEADIEFLLPSTKENFEYEFSVSAGEVAKYECSKNKLSR